MNSILISTLIISKAIEYILKYSNTIISVPTITNLTVDGLMWCKKKKYHI